MLVQEGHALGLGTAEEQHQALANRATPAWHVSQGAEPACMLGNLRAGCKYSVRVRGQNVAGWGPSSPPKEFLTMPDVPDAPFDLQTVSRCVRHMLSSYMD